MNQFIQRIKISILLLVALLFVVFPKRKVLSQPKTVLVIQMAKLGDMICTTPMFRAIKTKYPESRLLVLGNTVNEKVLVGNPHVDEYIIAQKSVLKMIRILRDAQIDVACMTIPSFELLATCIIARVPRIVVPRVRNGWSPIETYPYIFLSSFVITKDHFMGSYAPREYLKLLEVIDIHTTDTKKDIYFTDEAYQKTKKMLATDIPIAGNAFRVGVLLGAGNEIKAWAPEKFADLIDMIARVEQNAVFVLLGERKDADRAAVVKQKVKNTVYIIDYMDKLTLEELKAMVSQLSMLVGVDTGPQYIAEALGIPTVDIVGPCDEKEQPPMGDIHRIVKIDREKPQLFLMNARVYDVKEAKRQSEEITPEMAFIEFSILRKSMMHKH